MRQGALQTYTQSLQEELENLKRKFIVETRFKSKQEANEAKLSADLEAVESKLQQERALHRELEVAKKQVLCFIEICAHHASAAFQPWLLHLSNRACRQPKSSTKIPTASNMSSKTWRYRCKVVRVCGVFLW